MGHDTQVEYVDDSFSAWHGCSKKSAGCRMCFAADLARRWGQEDLWRRNGPRRVVAESTWRDPLKWNEQARREGRRRRILCGTMFDFLEDHPAVTAARARLFRLIEDTPWLIWVLFTKRPENVGMIPWDGPWPDNAWLVTSVENQEMADERIPLLLAVTGAPLLGLSVEPLLGLVDFTRFDLSRIGWELVGGESGSRARPMHPQWARDAIAQFAETGVPAWFKQHGTWGPADWTVPRLDGEPLPEYKARAAKTAATHLYAADADANCHRRVPVEQPAWSRDPTSPLAPGTALIRRWGKARAGHLLDGREIQQLPPAAYQTPEGKAT